MYQVIKFKLAFKLFINLNAHYGKVALPVFSDKNRLGIFMAELGYFIISVAQVGAWSDCWHNYYLQH